MTEKNDGPAHGSGRIQPSPALLVPADTPILDCVRLMNSHHVGSLLIVNERANGRNEEELIGIFTERDLLRKLEAIQKTAGWSKPVRIVMSSPVFTLPLDRINEAADAMLQNGFRHVPVLSQATAESPPRLAGVLSMRDLLRGQAGIVPEIISESGETDFDLGVVTRDEGLRQLLRKIVRIEPLSTQQALEPPTEGIRALLLDLDSLNPAEWLPLLKKLLGGGTKTRITLILVSAARQTPPIRRLLEQLAAMPQFRVFTKPANLLKLAQALQPSVRERRSPRENPSQTDPDRGRPCARASRRPTAQSGRATARLAPGRAAGHRSGSGLRRGVAGIRVG